MANLTTTTDLVNYVLEMMREKTDGTSGYAARVLTQLNRAYRAFWLGGVGLDTGKSGVIPWSWARSSNPKYFTLLPPYSTGTINVTRNSTSATFSNAPGYAVSDWHIRIDGEPETYRIVTGSGGAGITLSNAYVGTTNTSATFKAFKIRYIQTYDTAYFISPMLIHSNQGQHEVQMVSLATMQRDYPVSMIEEGLPTKCATTFQVESGITVQFNKYPRDYELVETNYVRTPDTLTLATGDLWMPIQYRVYVAEYALYYMLSGVDDDRADKHLKSAQRGFDSMVKEHTGMLSAGNRQFGRIIAREDENDDFERYVRTDDGFIIDMGS